MSCILCQGQLKKELVKYTLFYKEKWIIVENVPAQVCQQCGEKLFEPEIVDKLQKVIWEEKTPKKEVKTPIYDLSAA